jgi:hypothetical protein
MRQHPCCGRIGASSAHTRSIVTVPLSTAATPKDLPATIFVSLTDEFFESAGLPRPFELRPKRNTQDDPFDEHVAKALKKRLPAGVKVIASGNRSSARILSWRGPRRPAF